MEGDMKVVTYAGREYRCNRVTFSGIFVRLHFTGEEAYFAQMLIAEVKEVVEELNYDGLG